MAAYAALVSLLNTMDQIKIHPRISNIFDVEQIESLGETVGFLLDFIESYNCSGGSKEVEDLEGQISSAAHAAEDVIESHIVDQIFAGSTKKKGGSLPIMMTRIGIIMKRLMGLMEIHVPIVSCDLQKVTEDMESIKEYVEKQGRSKDGQLISLSKVPPSASSRPFTTGKTPMVGFDEYLIPLMDRLTSLPSHQQVIPITGMGGVGKTTLARNVFENLLIKQHFDVRAWATISQNYSVKEILLEILSSQDQETSRKFVVLNEQELGENLHKFLFNRRYLIILDDMWSVEAWNDIKFYFPDNNNGSRIVVTTRLHNVAIHFNSSYHTIKLMDEDKSWSLFCHESFGEEGCPAELERVGKKICGNCRGLPLSIVVIGGFLQKSSKSREYWEAIARDTHSILNSEGHNQCLNILSLSYNHLPAHLKPCFFYMGVFEENEVILVSRLIQLWVAEGFVRPNGGQSLEEVAEGYLADLVDRNLVLVKRWGCNGKMRACNIHDLIRELCLSVAEKENFFCVMKSGGTPETISRVRRIVIHKRMNISSALGSASLVRTLICKDSVIVHSNLLRVFRVVGERRRRGILDAALRCVNLRCLDLQHQFAPDVWFRLVHIPTQISLLWNLQTVRIEGYLEKIIAPSQLWEMVQLRHLQVNDVYVPDPPRSYRYYLSLADLQTFGNALDFRLSKEACQKIPNVKRLRLQYSEVPPQCIAGSYYCFHNLGGFHKLESLTLKFINSSLFSYWMVNIVFPTSLKKLSLYGGVLCWGDLERIGSLPNLEVLKLRACMNEGSEWNPVEGGFCRLKFLQIRLVQLTRWNADHFHFPVLEKLVLEYVSNLEEIPIGIGEIPTLKIISLIDCSLPCTLSAVKILEEQQSLGNEDLQLEVAFEKKDKVIRFREMVEEEGFTSINLHIEYAVSHFSYLGK